MSIEGFRPAEPVPDLQTILLEAVHYALRLLMDRPGYGLLREGDRQIEARVIQRLFVHPECHRLASLGPDDDEQQKSLRKAATLVTQHVYSQVLYDAITATRRPVQQEAYQELGRYFHQIAFNYFRQRHYSGSRAQEAAEDCAQEALLRVHQNSKQVREPGSFLGWARVILVHLCAHVLRDDIETPEVSEADLVAPDREDEAVSSFLESILATDAIAAVDLRDCCIQALMRLPGSNYRQVMILTYIGGFDDDEIAHILGMTKPNVQQYRSRALRRYLRADAELRACLEA